MSEAVVERKVLQELEEDIQRLVEIYELERKAAFCYQCGTCSGSCPVFMAEPEYNPRKMIMSLASGTWQSFINSEVAWLCAMCHTCLERCPQRIEVSEILTEVRNILARRGILPDIIAEKLRRVMERGMSAPYSKLIDKRRARYGLPPAPVFDAEAAKLVFDIFAVNHVLAAKKAREGGGSP